MSVRMKPRISGTLVVGLVISGALAIIPAVVTSTSGSLSLLVGLVGISIAFLVELMIRVERRENLVHRAFGIIDAFDRAPSIASDLEQAIMAAAAIIGNRELPLIEDAVERSVALFRQEIDDLRRGEYKVQTGSAALLTSQTRVVKSSIKAISTVSVDEAWWNSFAGEEYWAENVRALARGIDITRVFIFEGQPSAPMTAIMRNQASAGVKVYAINRTLIPMELVSNVVIFDERLLYLITGGSSEHDIRRVFVTNPITVRTACIHFEQLMQHILQYGIPSVKPEKGPIA